MGEYALGLGGTDKEHLCFGFTGRRITRKSWLWITLPTAFPRQFRAANPEGSDTGRLAHPEELRFFADVMVNPIPGAVMFPELL